MEQEDPNVQRRTSDGEQILPVKRQSLKDLFYEQKIDPDIEDGDKELSNDQESVSGNQNVYSGDEQRLIQGDHSDMIT